MTEHSPHLSDAENPLIRFLSNAASVFEQAALDMRKSENMSPFQILGYAGEFAAASLVAFKLAGRIESQTPAGFAVRTGLRALGLGSTAVASINVGVSSGFVIHELRKS